MSTPRESPQETQAPTKIEIQVRIAYVPGDPEPRVALILGENSIALRLPEAVSVAKAIADCCDQIRVDAAVAGSKAVLN